MAAITSNAAQVLRRMNARKTLVVKELTLAARQIGVVLNGQAKDKIQAHIMNVPIPLKKRADERLSAGAKLRTKTTKGSQGKWSRTGNLLRLETFANEGPVIVLRNNAKYAAARSALGGPNPPNAAGRRSGTQRPQAGIPDAQKSKTEPIMWQQVVILKGRDFILRKRREALLRALSGAK